MIVINGRTRAVADETITDPVQRVLADRGVADAGHDQVYHLSAANGRSDEWPSAIASLDLPAGRQVVLIPPDDAQLTLCLAAALYRRTGVFPVIARLSELVTGEA